LRRWPIIAAGDVIGAVLAIHCRSTRCAARRPRRPPSCSAPHHALDAERHRAQRLPRAAAALAMIVIAARALCGGRDQIFVVLRGQVVTSLKRAPASAR
jgi:hypothetical protein